MIIRGGISHYQNLQFFSIFFVGMMQVQVLCREENMIISASYIFLLFENVLLKKFYLILPNKWLLWKELIVRISALKSYCMML